MTKKMILLIIGFSISLLTIQAQINCGEQLVISNNAEGAQSVYAADIDGDGDIDVLSASSVDDKIAWYENIDGNGNFGEQQIISTNVSSPRDVFAADLDNDGDIDVLSASFVDDKIAWYENIDGNGSSWETHIVTTGGDGSWSVIAVDIDGDNDLDIVSASNIEKEVIWFENTNGNGDFGEQQIVNISELCPTSICGADIDLDGDIDIISSYEKSFFNDADIVWNENDGTGVFGEQQIITTSIVNAMSVQANDLDGDGDIDVFAASNDDNKITWYENTNGFGDFGEEQTITTSANWARSVYASDLDNDNDFDIISASWSDDKIAFYENIDGNGTFGEQEILTTNADGAYSVFSADIDGDGKKDVLSASLDDDKIAWYQNLTETKISFIQQKNGISIYPNPTNGILNFDFTDNNVQQIVISDITGKTIIEKVNIQQNEMFDLSSFESGIYIIKIQTDNEIFTTKIVKE